MLYFTGGGHPHSQGWGRWQVGRRSTGTSQSMLPQGLANCSSAEMPVLRCQRFQYFKGGKKSKSRFQCDTYQFSDAVTKLTHQTRCTPLGERPHWVQSYPPQRELVTGKHAHFEEKDLFYPEDNPIWGLEVMVVVKNLPAGAWDLRDLGSIPRSGRSSGGGHSNQHQYCCLENPKNRGAWQAIAHRDAKSWTWLKQLSKHSSMHRMDIFSSLQERLRSMRQAHCWPGMVSCQSLGFAVAAWQISRNMNQGSKKQTTVRLFYMTCTKYICEL